MHDFFVLKIYLYLKCMKKSKKFWQKVYTVSKKMYKFME
ncbi:protein of unknown function [Clostridium beijerinckii]|nr:protein of unknown function [Clostridium beijerinckii]